MKIKSIIFFIGILISSFTLKAQFKLNVAVDTVFNKANKPVLKTLYKYIKARKENKDAKGFWIDKEVKNHKRYDFNDDIINYMEVDKCIILGITQPKKNVFKVKLQYQNIGTDGANTIYYVVNYILYKQDDDYRLGNTLLFNINQHEYVKIESNKIDYYFPQKFAYSKDKIDSANRYLSQIESFFDKALGFKLNYMVANSCEELYNLKGYDYLAGTLSSINSTCGFYDQKNLIIYSANGAFYKHELLRTLNTILPATPEIFRDGLTNLCGGSRGFPIIYHLKKLYPYLLEHPEKFSNLDDFYYYDEETSPGFVFNALITNYVIKKEGREGFLKIMVLESNKDISIADFLRKQYDISDLKTFFLSEFSEYRNKAKLEHENLFEKGVAH